MRVGGGGGKSDIHGGEKWQLHENKGRRTRKPTHSATPRDRHTTRKGTTPAPYRLLQAGEGALCVVMGCPDHERWGPTWGADLGVAARAPSMFFFSRAVRIGTLGTAVPCFPPKTPPKTPPPIHFGGITRQKPACGNFQHRDDFFNLRRTQPDTGTNAATGPGTGRLTFVCPGANGYLGSKASASPLNTDAPMSFLPL